MVRRNTKNEALELLNTEFDIPEEEVTTPEPSSRKRSKSFDKDRKRLLINHNNLLKDIEYWEGVLIKNPDDNKAKRKVKGLKERLKLAGEGLPQKEVRKPNYRRNRGKIDKLKPTSIVVPD